MNAHTLHTVYFIGIGGIGMSALARYFNAQGAKVSGYDKTRTPLTDTLEAEGIRVHFDDDVAQIPAAPDLVVYTPAIPSTHRGLEHCRHRFTVKKRAEVLGMLTERTRTIAVAGTHGKTTTSSMVAHIMKEAGTTTSAFLGGIAVNYNSNLVLSAPTDTTVVEADEYDRSFLQLHPDLAIITSMDADHLDIYGAHDAMQESFTQFAELSSTELVLRKGLELKRPINARVSSYALEEEADYAGRNVRIENGRYHMDVLARDVPIDNIALGIPGRHNAENAVAAIAVSLQAGVAAEKIRAALGSFKGIRRRFEYVINTATQVFIDDYAHHPSELQACIASVRELYPDKKITGVFQPHLYSRTRDFADQFAAALDALDSCILLPIYPARELPMEGVSSGILLDRMQMQDKQLVSKAELPALISSAQPEVLLTLGAGDIDQLVPELKNVMLKTLNTTAN